MRDRSPKTAGAFVLSAVIGLLLLPRPAPVAAQVTRADSAAVLLDAAMRLSRSGRIDAARALYEMILDRFGDTEARSRAAQLLERVAVSTSASAGRVELQIWSTLYGLWLGVAVPAAFGANDPEPYGVGLLLGGPAGFFSGLALARSRTLTLGQARAITFGGTWGTWQGFGWSEVFDWGEHRACDIDFCDSSSGAEEKFAGMIIGGLAGIGTGVILSNRKISDGVATSVSLGSLWGSWFGVAVGVLADLEDDRLLASTLLGGDAGIIAATLLATKTNVSRNRARLTSIAGVIGGLAGGGLDLIIQPDGDKALIGIPLTGSIAGLLIGSALTTDRDGPGDSGGGGSDGALLHLDGRDLRLGTPSPFPVTVDGRVGGRVVLRPALGLTLFRARF